MMEQTLAVQRMQDYIERHLEETITLADLAKASMFSPWYSTACSGSIRIILRQITSEIKAVQISFAVEG